MIVDDSSLIRRILTGWFNESPDFKIVAAHSNGRRAADDIGRTQPDVVILDIEMPEMDGLTALPLILERKPGTAVIVASTLSRRGAEVSLKALTLGASDYLTKPDTGDVSSAQQFRDDLMEKARQLGQRAKKRTSLRVPRAERPTAPPAVSAPGPTVAAPSPATAPSAAPAPAALRDVAYHRAPSVAPKLRAYSRLPPRIVAIGSSTGGPQALSQVFADLGPAMNAVPVVIAQHMPPTFTAILAEHIAKVANRRTSEGVDGEPLLPGRIYVAPGGKHMLVAKAEGGGSIIRLSDAPPVNFCKPAVDPLFESVASLYGNTTLGIVLTGMGSDGARGADVIAKAGGSIIAQDEATSVVWGMPGATVAIGACADILPLVEIGRKAARILSGGRA